MMWPYTRAGAWHSGRRPKWKCTMRAVHH